MWSIQFALPFHKCRSVTGRRPSWDGGRRSPILRPTRKEPLAKWPCFDPPHTGPLLPIHLLDFYYLLRHADRMTKSTWLIGQNRQDKRRDFFTHCERRASPILPLWIRDTKQGFRTAPRRDPLSSSWHCERAAESTGARKCSSTCSAGHGKEMLP